VNDSHPLLLLDIDGVLNPYAAPECPADYREHVLFPGEEPIRVRGAHAGWLKELSARFDIVWASGWGEDARVLERLYSVARLPSVPFPPVPFGFAEKLAAVDAYVGERSVAWVDDLIDDRAYAWASRRLAPTLLLSTDPAVGLERDHIETLLAWRAERKAPGTRGTRR
jgi:hypothetical protein